MVADRLLLSSSYHSGMMAFMAVLDDLRTAVAKDGRTHTAIATAAGIHVKTFSAFINRRRGLSIETAESLAKALGFTVKLVQSR
jgi:plasmid maintenance system antidote protein VapI